MPCFRFFLLFNLDYPLFPDFGLPTFSLDSELCLLFSLRLRLPLSLLSDALSLSEKLLPDLLLLYLEDWLLENDDLLALLDSVSTSCSSTTVISVLFLRLKMLV